jgi:hypothetical protein
MEIDKKENDHTKRCRWLWFCVVSDCMTMFEGQPELIVAVAESKPVTLSEDARCRFAIKVKGSPVESAYFAALDGKLSLELIKKIVKTPEDSLKAIQPYLTGGFY